MSSPSLNNVPSSQSYVPPAPGSARRSEPHTPGARRQTGVKGSDASAEPFGAFGGAPAPAAAAPPVPPPPWLRREGYTTRPSQGRLPPDVDRDRYNRDGDYRQFMDCKISGTTPATTYEQFVEMRESRRADRALDYISLPDWGYGVDPATGFNYTAATVNARMIQLRTNQRIAAGNLEREERAGVRLATLDLEEFGKGKEAWPPYTSKMGELGLLEGDYRGMASRLAAACRSSNIVQDVVMTLDTINKSLAARHIQVGWRLRPPMPNMSWELTLLRVPEHARRPRFADGSLAPLPFDVELVDEPGFIALGPALAVARQWRAEAGTRDHPDAFPRVDPASFTRPPRTPEILLQTVTGVTIPGVSETRQCGSKTEHEILRFPAHDWARYSTKMSEHGITYEEYVCMIAGFFEITQRAPEEFDNYEFKKILVFAIPSWGASLILWALNPKMKKGFWGTERDVRLFFYAASENLQRRGVPLTIKIKRVSDLYGDELWQNREIVIRHQPPGTQMRKRSLLRI